MIEAWILDAEHKPVRAASYLEWGEWMDTREGIVGNTAVGDCVVSTAFIGLASEVINRSPHFETMVFKDGKSQGYQERCGTWIAALEQHTAGVKWAMEQTQSQH